MPPAKSKHNLFYTSVVLLIRSMSCGASDRAKQSNTVLNHRVKQHSFSCVDGWSCEGWSSVKENEHSICVLIMKETGQPQDKLEKAGCLCFTYPKVMITYRKHSASGTEERKRTTATPPAPPPHHCPL